MTKRIIFSLFIVTLTLSSVKAKDVLPHEGQIKREFTVTSIALDAENARLQSDESTDTNDTTIQGGATEEN